ncbi:hypothetical protein ACFQ7J_11415 [Streptomyces sp. NPDC056501]
MPKFSGEGAGLLALVARLDRAVALKRFVERVRDTRPEPAGSSTPWS